MLYISRRIGRGMYGVVDTDDGVEETRTWEEITRIVRDNKIEIEGVVSVRYCQSDTISYVEPYQDILTKTPAQLKLELISNVEMKLYGDMITSIVVRNVKQKRKIAIRLSDYGSSCADCMLLGNVKLMEDIHTTLVLDDNVTLSEYTFALRNPNMSAVGMYSDVGVHVDLLDVTREDTVQITYDKVGLRAAMLYIRDNDERKRRMFGMSSYDFNKYKARFPSYK